jgi:hypothetical protein
MLVLKELPTGLVYKLHDGDDPHGMMGVMLRDASPHINRGRMSCRVRISRQTPDRSRDVVVSKGGIFLEHQANPVVCLSHNKNYVCGMAESNLGQYTVHVSKDGEGVDAETYFSQHSELGEQSFRLIENKVLRGASIGFLPVGLVTKSHAGGNLYSQWRLVEYSHLPLPDHPDCLVEAVFKGLDNKPLCGPLMDILKPMCPERPESVVSGFQSEVTIDGRKYVAVDFGLPVTKGHDSPKRGCVMVPLSGTAAQAVLNAGKSIADDDLAEDGRETDPHVTVRYGFMPSVEASEVERIALPYGPIGFTLGHTGVFAGSEHDVVYFTVNPNKSDGLVPSSPVSGVPTAVYPSSDRALWELHEALGDLSHEDTHPTYIAHACIAYVKPGLGEKYAKMIGYPRSGIGCFATELAYSSAGKERSIIPLVGTKSLKAKLNTSAIKSATVERQPAPTVHKTYLQRMRTKAMNPEDDDTLAGAAAPEQVDDTLPPDPSEVPADPNADPAADVDGMTDTMKPFAQLCHTAHEQLMQIMQGLDAGLSDTEHPQAGKMADKVKAALGKAIATVQAAYSDYQQAHTDQPDIPGAEAAPEGLDSDDDDDEIPDDDDDSELDTGDEVDDDEEDEPKSKEKAWAQYAVKSFQGYWDYIHTKAFAGDKPAMDDAARLLAEVAKDKQQPLPRRQKANVIAKRLRGGLVTKAADDWSGIKLEDLATLQKQVAAIAS